MSKKWKISLLFLLVIFQSTALVHAQTESVNISNQRQLFIDDYIIENTSNVSLVLHHPKDEGSVLKFDNPWEGPFCGYSTVIKDGELYRLYYRGIPESGKDGRSNEVTCYAESNDGLFWRKPMLGLYEVRGTKDNNVILANASPVTHNFSPFLDTKPNVKPEERFKGLGGIKESGLVAYISPDGIHWQRKQEEAVFNDGVFDSQNVSFWSEVENVYLCYFRTWTETDYGGFRTISRTTSQDFVNWTKPVKMDFGDTPHEHLYTNQTHPYFRAPQIYVAVAARFFPKRQVLSEEQAKKLNVNPKYFKDCSDAVFMTSRGGNLYSRTFMEGFIRPGIGFENWVSRSNYPTLNVVQTGPTEMSIFVNRNYAQPTANLYRYSLRLDGFSSAHAPYNGGELVTKPFTFQGSSLEINFSTSAAGSIQVELLDERGDPASGLSLDDCPEIIGDEISKIVTWNNNPLLDNLNGKTVRLRFVLRDADLYSFRFF